MIAILYPLKMDKLSEAYSAIYEELSPGLQRSEANVKKNIATQAAANKKVESDRAKTASEFQAHKKEVMSKGGRPVDALDSWQKKKIEARKEVKDSYEPLGKYRSQWESLKLQEHNDYREEFDSWIGALAEEGYDIDRWDDIELVETFINELNLWGSQDAVVEALMNSEVELDEEDKKGKGSGTKDACYHKVKSRYSVWPSAYASGALVKCRKKGAKNWGNSSKKEGFSDWRDDLGLLDENRATAYTAGMSDEQKDVEMRKISPKVAKEAGKLHDRFMFKSRKKGGDFNKKYNKEVLKDKKYNQNTTGRGTPVSYRKGYGDEDLGRYQSKIRQGEGSIKDLGKKK